MARVKHLLPLVIAVFFGWLTLIGLLIPVPDITRLVLGWASLLVAFALILGVLNLFVVHVNRVMRQKNIYSLFLITSMMAVFAITLTDMRDLTNNWLDRYFVWVQAPLEAALSSLLAFFLLFAGFQLMKRQRTTWSLLFLVTALLVLGTDVLQVTPWLPSRFSQGLIQIQDIIHNVIVNAGMRGLLIGVALGTIMLAIRMLIGLERPYNK